MAYCTAAELAEFMKSDLPPTVSTRPASTGEDWPDETLLTRHVDMVAAEINSALMSSNQYDCVQTAGSGGVGWGLLKMLNLTGATLVTVFDNMRQIPQADLDRWQTWKDAILIRIQDSDLSVCEGQTGKKYPAFSTAEQAWTPEGASDIIMKTYFRNLS